MAIEHDPPGSAAERAVDAGQDDRRRQPGHHAAGDRLDADPAEAAELEVRQPVVEDRQQGQRFEPGGDRDGDGDPGQAERPDQDRPRGCS